MLNLTKDQCDEFTRNPSKNPLTGRKIDVGKALYKQLEKACLDRKSKSKSIQSPVGSIQNREAPPMGPWIHWNYKAKTSDDKEEHLLDMYQHIAKRVSQIEKSNEKQSKMEFDEFHDIVKVCIQKFKNDKDYFSSMTKGKDFMNAVEKQKEFTSDIPKEKDVAGLKVSPKRVEIRENVHHVWAEFKFFEQSIFNSLNKKRVDSVIPSQNFKIFLEKKKYLDYLIKHKIFSYDDIYKNTFPSENVFDEIKEDYKKYAKLFKQSQGYSP
jgi:hypothetical protein